MAERRIASIAAIAPSKRTELISGYAALVQQRLQQQFPTAIGYEYNLKWDTSGGVNTRRNPEEIRNRCPTVQIKVVKGRNWGIAIVAGPVDTALGHFQVIIKDAIPWIERLKGWILIGAAAVAALAAFALAGLEIWQKKRMPDGGFHSAYLIGMAVFIALALAGFLLLLPVRGLFSLYHMREGISTTVAVVNQAWSEMQGVIPGLLPLMRKRSPSFLFSAWLLVSLGVLGACYWFPHWPDQPAGLSFLLGFVMVAAGLAALYMFLGLMVSLFGLLKE